MHCRYVFLIIYISNWIALAFIGVALNNGVAIR